MAYKPKLVIVHSTGTETDEATNTGEVDGYSEASYAAAHDAATAIFVSNNAYVPITNQYYAGATPPYWSIYRGGLQFPVSTGLTVTSASIHLWGLQVYAADGAFNGHLVSGSALAGTLVATDYGDLLSATTSFGSIASSAFVTEGWNEFALTSDGKTALQNAITSGIFRVGVRHGNDIANSAATGSNSGMEFYGSEALSSPKPRSHFQIIGY